MKPNGTKILWACGRRPPGSKKFSCWYQRVDRDFREPTTDLRRCVEVLTILSSDK